MPLYEYRCRDCGQRFEILQRMGEDGRGLACPHCGASAPERMLSTFAAQGGASRDSAASSGASCCRGPGFT